MSRLSLPDPPRPEPSSTARSPAESNEPKSLLQLLGTVSARLDPEVSGTGQLAALRRTGWDEFPPEFWRFYLAHVPAEWREPNGRALPAVDRAWAAIFRAMVECAPRPQGFDTPFAAALAETGYSEARFIRLLRADEENLFRELRTAAVWLSRAGAKANWEDPAELVLGRVGELRRIDEQRRLRAPDGVTHRMARDYFRTAAASS